MRRISEWITERERQEGERAREGDREDKREMGRISERTRMNEYMNHERMHE
jgi:hypothetical protein